MIRIRPLISISSTKTYYERVKLNNSSNLREKLKNGPIPTTLFYYSLNICAEFELSKNL